MYHIIPSAICVHQIKNLSFFDSHQVPPNSLQLKPLVLRIFYSFSDSLRYDMYN